MFHGTFFCAITAITVFCHPPCRRKLLDLCLACYYAAFIKLPFSRVPCFSSFIRRGISKAIENGCKCLMDRYANASDALPKTKCIICYNSSIIFTTKFDGRHNVDNFPRSCLPLSVSSTSACFSPFLSCSCQFFVAFSSSSSVSLCFFAPLCFFLLFFCSSLFPFFFSCFCLFLSVSLCFSLPPLALLLSSIPCILAPTLTLSRRSTSFRVVFFIFYAVFCRTDTSLVNASSYPEVPRQRPAKSAAPASSSASPMFPTVNI